MEAIQLKEIEEMLSEAFQLQAKEKYERLQTKAKFLSETTTLSYQEAFYKLLASILRGV